MKAGALRDAIPGDYQYRAITRGPAFQRAWHRAKLQLVDVLVQPVAAGTRVLDVGCGSGVVANHLASKGCRVLGIDSNHDAIEFARTQFPSANLRFEEKLIQELELHERFDWILCLEVLEHLSVNAACDLLVKLRSAAAPQGMLLLSTPNYRGAWPLIEWLADRSGKVAHLDGYQHITRFTRGRMRSAVRRAGWRILRDGTYSTLAPVAGVASEKLAARAFSWELRAHLPFGNLLYLVATNPVAS